VLSLTLAGRAIALRLRQGHFLPKVALAVVVQQLVPAERRPSCFTAPGERQSAVERVINAAWAGRAVVGGLVTPDCDHRGQKPGPRHPAETAERL